MLSSIEDPMEEWMKQQVLVFGLTKEMTRYYEETPGHHANETLTEKKTVKTIGSDRKD